MIMLCLPLSVVLSESNVDIDKVLLKLDAKDFTVEKSTLQSLQQLIQWVADLTLSILVRLPENRCNHNRSGVRLECFGIDKTCELNKPSPLRSTTSARTLWL